MKSTVLSAYHLTNFGGFKSPASIKPQVLWRGLNPRYKTVLPTSDFRLPTSLILILLRVQYSAAMVKLSPQLASQVLASSDSLGKVTLWNLDFDSSPEKLLVQACDRVRDYLNNSADVKENERGLCVGVARLRHRIGTVKVSQEIALVL
jgi:hypothetical protein